MFVGRKDEQARFAVLLGELSAGRRGRVRVWPPSRRSGGDPADADRSRVVLVHGLGGSGKSRLLRQFREMADGKLPDSPVALGQVRTVFLDWEDEQRDQPSDYAGMDGPGLVTVLDAVQRAVTGAFAADAKAAERVGQAFSNYRQGAARMPQYVARFADVIAQSRQAGSAFTRADAAALLRTGASAGLVGIGHPGGLWGLTPDQIAATAQAAGNLSDAAVRAVTGRKPGEITRAEYDLVTDPARELTRRAAAAVRAATGRTPLVVLLDTGEVIGGRAWGWLRRVMTQTGPQVIWVAGARFATEAEAGYDSPVAQFVRDIGHEHLMLMSPTRFDDQMIRDYLESRASGRRYTDAQIDLIARYTGGAPLAVSLTAQLVGDGEPVEQVCHDPGGGRPGSVVSALARRYLVHAERQEYPPGDPRAGDVMKILGLALAFGDLRDDPELLAALWGVTDPMTAFADLARRHDFVLPLSRRLHDDVHGTLRTDLLDPYRRIRVREISQRAVSLYCARLSQMRGRWPALDDQLDHSGFTTALQGVLWHTLWVDNQAGLDLLTGILPVLEATDPSTADAAAAIADWFSGTFSDDQRHDLDLLTEVWDDPVGWPVWETATRRARRARLTVPGLALHSPGTAAVDPVIGDPGDRQAAIMILQARLEAGNDGGKGAIAHLRTAAARTTSTRLRQVIGSEADTMANRLIWPVSGGAPVRTATGLAAAKIATETLNDSAPWRTYAVALILAYRFEEALTACDEAITLDPGYAAAHRERGIALEYLGRFEEALAAVDQAITLEPRYAAAHRERGAALRYLGRFEEALAAVDQAITLDPGDAASHNGKGPTLFALGRSEEALAACDQAITLEPGYFVAHANKGIILAATGDLDDALAELDVASRLAPSEAGAAHAWAAAILWHQGDAAGARDRFARVEGTASLSPFGKGEIEAVALCGLGQPDAAEQHLLDALLLLAPGDLAKPRAIYFLLSNPPLAGIDRLRAIVDSAT